MLPGQRVSCLWRGTPLPIQWGSPLYRRGCGVLLMAGQSPAAQALSSHLTLAKCLTGHLLCLIKCAKGKQDVRSQAGGSPRAGQGIQPTLPAPSSDKMQVLRPITLGRTTGHD